MTDLRGLRLIVTGGSSGIGLAVATQAAASGAQVVVLDLAAPETADVAFERADVGDSTGVSRAVEAAAERLGGIDIVVNNAGVGSVGDVTQATDEEWHRVLNINVIGTARVTSAAVRYLRDSDNPSIVNVSSVVAVAGVPQRAVYAASKGAVYSLTLAMAADYCDEGIRVNCVAPGTVDTPWVARLLSGADDPAATKGVVDRTSTVGAARDSVGDCGGDSVPRESGEWMGHGDRALDRWRGCWVFAFRADDCDQVPYLNSEQPPSMVSTLPVMYDAASDTRNATASATSSVVCSSPSGMTSAMTDRNSGFSSATLRAAPAFTIPGATAFTRIAVRCEIARHHLHEHFESTLAGAVGRHTRPRHRADPAARHHDVAARVLHGLRCGEPRVETSCEVHVDVLRPQLRSHLQKGGHDSETCVRDHARYLGQPRNRRLDRVVVPHVRLRIFDSLSVYSKLVELLLRLGIVGEIDEQDLPPLREEFVRDPRTDVSQGTRPPLLSLLLWASS